MFAGGLMEGIYKVIGVITSYSPGVPEEDTRNLSE
jgi:hypothetical protein